MTQQCSICRLQHTSTLQDRVESELYTFRSISSSLCKFLLEEECIRGHFLFVIFFLLLYTTDPLHHFTCNFGLLSILQAIIKYVHHELMHHSVSIFLSANSRAWLEFCLNLFGSRIAFHKVSDASSKEPEI